MILKTIYERKKKKKEKEKKERWRGAKTHLLVSMHKEEKKGRRIFKKMQKLEGDIIIIII